MIEQRYDFYRYYDDTVAGITIYYNQNRQQIDALVNQTLKDKLEDDAPNLTFLYTTAGRKVRPQKMWPCRC